MHELLLQVVLSIAFSQSTQLGVGAKDQVDTGAVFLFGSIFLSLFKDQRVGAEISQPLLELKICAVCFTNKILRERIIWVS